MSAPYGSLGAHDYSPADVTAELQRQSWQPGQMANGNPGNAFDQLDTNHDGALSRDEFDRIGQMRLATQPNYGSQQGTPQRFVSQPSYQQPSMAGLGSQLGYQQPSMAGIQGAYAAYGSTQQAPQTYNYSYVAPAQAVQYAPQEILQNAMAVPATSLRMMPVPLGANVSYGQSGLVGYGSGQNWGQHPSAGGGLGGGYGGGAGGSSSHMEQHQSGAVIAGARYDLGEEIVQGPDKFVQGVQKQFMVNKKVAVPSTKIVEREKKVKKPSIIERIIEVPKPEIREITKQLPPTIRHEEQIVEVPKIVVEERIVHRAKKVQQERLIEVPKIEYVERIEYEDIIEYREVPVDKIVEVPEIEYRIKEVEHLVPQPFIQEYYVDNYHEVPVTQVQETAQWQHVAVYAEGQQAADWGGPVQPAMPAMKPKGHWVWIDDGVEQIKNADGSLQMQAGYGQQTAAYGQQAQPVKGY